MNTNPKELLVSKSEIFFNKKDLLELLSSATDSNIVVVSTKHHAADNEIHVSFHAQPKLLNTVTGEITPAKGEGKIAGYSSIPCPYPPGCNPAQSVAKAQLMSSYLKLKGQGDK